MLFSPALKNLLRLVLNFSGVFNFQTLSLLPIVGQHAYGSSVVSALDFSYSLKLGVLRIAFQFQIFTSVITVEP